VLTLECPLAHVCPYLWDTPAGARQLEDIPRDHIEKLLQKCPRLANSPQAKHHVTEAFLGEDQIINREGRCPYLAHPADNANMHEWEEFYKHAAECPWIQEHGIRYLAKSPKAWEAALEVSQLCKLIDIRNVLLYRRSVQKKLPSMNYRVVVQRKSSNSYFPPLQLSIHW